MTNEEAQLLVAKHLSKSIQEWAGGEEEADAEAGDEFARLVVETLGLRIIAVEAETYTAQININKEASKK